MSKVKKPTKSEQRIEAAKELIWKPLHSQEAQAEAAMILKTELKLSRNEIANALGLTFRQVMRRLHRYKFMVADGLIPTAELDYNYKVAPKAELLEDEDERLERTALNRESRTMLLGETFEEKLASAVAIHLPTKVDLKNIDALHQKVRKLRPKTKGDEEVAMATISDAHLGLLNPHFNLEIAKEALRTYLRKCIRLTDLHRTQCNVKTIHLNLLGDNIQGSGANYANQRWDTMLCAVDQTDVFVQVVIEFIESLLVEFDEVVVNCQPGNHGYIAPKKTSTEPEHANYETLAHRTLRYAFRGNKRVKFNISDEWFQIIDVQGQRFFMTHGHAMKGAGSLDGIIGVIRKWQDVLAEFDHVIFGHFHRLNRLALPRVFGSHRQRTAYMNGTTVMGDTFIEQFGASHTNEYWFKFIGQDRITAEYAVQLY